MKSLVTLIPLSVPPVLSLILSDSRLASTVCVSFNLAFLSLFFLYFLLVSSLFLYFSAVFLSPSPPPLSSSVAFLSSSSLFCLSCLFLSPSASRSLVDQTVEAAKLPEARADRGAALSDLPPSPERQTNADTPISCKETIIHHLYQLSVFLS